MNLEHWLAFVVTAALVLVIPGPTILTVISYSVTYGRRANLPLVGAVALGDSTALLMSLVGLGTLLAQSALWFAIVKTVGGLYLLFLGIRLLRAGIAPAQTVSAIQTTDARPAMLKLFVNTYVVTALNPKGIVFYVAFLPQFIRPEAEVPAQLWILAATFVGLAIINATLYTVFAASARTMLSAASAQRRFNVLGGSLLSAAGVWALFARRA